MDLVLQNFRIWKFNAKNISLSLPLPPQISFQILTLMITKKLAVLLNVKCVKKIWSKIFQNIKVMCSKSCLNNDEKNNVSKKILLCSQKNWKIIPLFLALQYLFVVFPLPFQNSIWHPIQKKKSVLKVYQLYSRKEKKILLKYVIILHTYYEKRCFEIYKIVICNSKSLLQKMSDVLLLGKQRMNKPEKLVWFNLLQTLILPQWFQNRDVWMQSKNNLMGHKSRIPTNAFKIS